MKKIISGTRIGLMLSFVLLLLTQLKAELPYRYAKVLNGVDEHHKMFTVAAKDTWGMIWLVSGGELFRYDGVSVTPFSKLYEKEIPFEDVQSIATDPWNRIWINGRNRIYIFDPHVWAFLENNKLTKRLTDHKAISFCRSGDAFFVATETGEVWQIDKQRKTLLFSFDPKKRLRRPTIDRLFKADEEAVWLAFDGTLYHYDRIKRQQQARSIPLAIFNFVEDILPLRQGLLLRSYKDGYYVYNGVDFVATNLHSEAGNDFSNWNHWAFGDTNSIKIFHKSGQYFEYSRDCSFRQLKKGYHRLDQNVFPKKLNGWMRMDEEWLLATDDGLYAVFPAALRFEFLEIGSARGMIRQKGNYYFGGYGHLDKMTAQGELQQLNRTPRYNYYAFLKTHPDTAYIALEGDFLGLLLGDQVVKAPLSIPDNVKDRFSNMALCISGYHADSLLVGTANGIWRYSKRSGAVSPLTDNKGRFFTQGMRILSLRFDNNSISFTSEEGYYKVERHIAKKIYPQDNKRLLIYDHLILGTRTYLASKGRGIILLDSGKPKIYTVQEGLTSNIVYQLYAIDGTIFAGTHHGLSVLKNNNIFNYHVVDGLPFEEFNHQASFYDEQAKLLFMGGTGGYISFDPATLTSSPPNQHITAPLLASLSIGLRENKFINNFATAEMRVIDLPQETMMVSLNFSKPNHYRAGYHILYKIEPYMDHFQAMPRSNQLNLSGVKAGQYKIVVKLVSSSNAHTKTWTWQLNKAPLFFETQLFYLLVLLAVALLTSLFLFQRGRREQGERKLRRQISSDLHDEVGGLLTGISMQADLLRYRPSGQQQENIDAISQYSREATQMMDDIVWTIDARNNYQGSLEDRIKFLAQQMLLPLKIDLKFEVQSDYDRKIPQSIRQNIYLILKETLHNICKHAKSTHVHITFRINSRTYFLEVKNDGVAKYPAVQGIRSGQGTRNMKRRAQQIKARLYIWKREDQYFVQLSGYFQNSPWQRWLRRFKRKWHV